MERRLRSIYPEGSARVWGATRGKADVNRKKWLKIGPDSSGANVLAITRWHATTGMPEFVQQEFLTSTGEFVWMRQQDDSTDVISRSRAMGIYSRRSTGKRAGACSPRRRIGRGSAVSQWAARETSICTCCIGSRPIKRSLRSPADVRGCTPEYRSAPPPCSSFGHK